MRKECKRCHAYSSTISPLFLSLLTVALFVSSGQGAVQSPSQGFLADLSIARSHDPGFLLPGDPWTWTLTVHNNDATFQADARDVVVTEILSEGLALERVISSQGSCQLIAKRFQVVVCPLGALLSGKSATIDIVATVEPDINRSTLSNTAFVVDQGETLDPVLGNNIATAAVIVRSPQVDLSISVTTDAGLVRAGDPLTWILKVESSAAYPATAMGVIVTDRLPAEVAFVSARSSQGRCNEQEGMVTCALGSLRSSGVATIELTVVADATGAISNAAMVTSSTADTDRDNNTAAATATVTPAFLISPTCVAPGSSMTLVDFAPGVALSGQVVVRVNGVPAKTLAVTSKSLIVEIPQLRDGQAQVTVEGVPGLAGVRVDSSCGARPLTTEDVQAGFVAGDGLIFFKAGLSAQEIEQFRLEYGISSLIGYPLLGFYLAKLPHPSEGAEMPLVSCPVNKRSTAPEVDALLLIDLSGTMDSSLLKPLIVELLNRMYCALNRNSRVALMTYNSSTKLAFGFAPWAKQYQALRGWIEQPPIPQSQSDLGLGLRQAFQYFKESARSDVPKHIVVITRGPIYPRIEQIETLIDRARSESVTVQGLALVNRFFTPGDYAPLRQIAQATGRDAILFDERNWWALPETITCTVVQGFYGITGCGKEALAQIPSTAAKETEDLIRRLNQDPRVEQAFLNHLVDTAQDDPGIADEEWLRKLGLPEGWDTFFPHRGEGVTIAVIDTGVDLGLTQAGSPELALKPLAPEGLNFAPVSSDFKGPMGQDELGHGTVVSTIIAAFDGNGFNGAGVAPKATIIPMKVFALAGGQVKASNEWVAKALMNAFALQVDVVNMSLGCQGCNNQQERALRKFYDSVISNLMKEQSKAGRKAPVLVAASGNDGERWIDAPAANPSVIAVGSARPDYSSRSAFSNYGPELAFVAIGEQTLTTVMGGGFASPGSGTSFAAPQVAGLAALILAEEPGLTPEGVKDKIKSCFTVDVGPPGFDEETGWGRIWLPPPTEAKPGCLRGKEG